MRLIDTEVVLDIASAHFGDQTVNNLHVKLRALKGLIEASDMTGNLYGGKLAATWQLGRQGQYRYLQDRRQAHASRYCQRPEQQPNQHRSSPATLP